MPTLGSIVQNGKLAASALPPIALKRVLCRPRLTERLQAHHVSSPAAAHLADVWQADNPRLERQGYGGLSPAASLTASACCTTHWLIVTPARLTLVPPTCELAGSGAGGVSGGHAPRHSQRAGVLALCAEWPARSPPAAWRPAACAGGRPMAAAS